MSIELRLSPGRRPIGKRIGAALAGTMLLAGCTESGGFPSPLPASLHYDEQGCLNPTAVQLKDVTKELYSPEMPNVTYHAQFLSVKVNIEHKPELNYEQYRDWQHAAARQNGLELRDAPHLSDEEKTILAKHPRAVFKSTRSFLRQYDLGLAVPQTEEELTDVLGSPIAPKDLYTPENAKQMQRLQQIVQKYPINYFKRIGVDTIALMRGDDDVEIKKGVTIDVGGEVNLGNDPNAIFLDPRSVEVFDHEAFHQFDKAVGCMVNTDTQYEERNGKVAIYADPQERPKDVYSLPGLATVNNNRRYAGESELGMSSVYVNTDYAFTHSTEDKAEIGKDTFDFDTFTMACNSGSEVLKNKFILLFARLKLFEPAFAKYLLTVNPHCHDSATH